MNAEETGIPPRRGWRARTFPAIVVLLLLASSFGYGFLVYSRHLFPYRLLRRAHRAIRSSGHDAPGRRATGAPASLDAIRQLANLPYLEGYRPPTAGGVIRAYDRARSEDGLNFFTSAGAPVATLMDMDGRVVKSWTADARKAIPGIRIDERQRGHERFLRDAELLPDGGIVAMFDEIGLVRLDSSSRVLWAWRGSVHHDLFVDAGSHIWAIAHERRVRPELRRAGAVLDDDLVELSAEGKLLRRISLADCFERSRYATMLSSMPSMNEDIFHTNSVAVLDGTAPAGLSAFRRGNLLVSVKRLSTVVVIDPDAREVVWALTGQWYGQHSAQFSPTGHLLLFDNLGTMRLASRVLEVDPMTQRVLWSFGGRPGEDLLSETVGFVDRLRNGNTLITESNHGRVLEVTPDNRVVWEFDNPIRVGKRRNLVATVYFMERVPRRLPFLAPTSVSRLSETPMPSRAW
jgi:Arylsulfotransferase (ASST)